MASESRLAQVGTTIPVRNVQDLAAGDAGELTAEALERYISPLRAPRRASGGWPWKTPQPTALGRGGGQAQICLRGVGLLSGRYLHSFVNWSCSFNYSLRKYISYTLKDPLNSNLIRFIIKIILKCVCLNRIIIKTYDIINLIISIWYHKYF